MFSRRNSISKIRKLHILDMQEGLCAACSKPIPHEAQIDHIRPLALGGTNELNNLQALCKDCHRTKTATDKAAIAKAPKTKDFYYLREIQVKQKQHKSKKFWGLFC